MEKRKQKILVPIDFTPSSEAAIKVANQFARLHGAEIVLLHVMESVTPLAELFSNGEAAEKKYDFSAKMLEKMVAQHTTEEIPFSYMVGDGKPYNAILKTCEEIGAEMIVMGTWGSHAVEMGMIGSNVNKVVRSAKVPVVTVTKAPEHDKFMRILIAVDPAFGIRELRHLLAVYHKTYNPMVELVSIAINERESDELKLYLKKQSAALYEQGIKDVTTTVRIGGIISDAILAYVQEAGHDMIWMETHGRKGISGWILGSITEEVLQYSPVPVLSLHPERESVARYYYHSNFPI